jgi:hypothetical protein
MIQKRHPGEGGAVLLGGERAIPTKSDPILQPLDDLRALRALYLIQHCCVQPETAAALALLAFGGAG